MLDNIFTQFGTKLYRQEVGIPMGTNCAPLVANLFLFCYERDFMMPLSDNKQADVPRSALHPMESISLNSFVSLEHLAML